MKEYLIVEYLIFCIWFMPKGCQFQVAFNKNLEFLIHASLSINEGMLKH